MKADSDHKIDIMIIGAQKAGSSSLKKYLSLHPRIITHFPKEFDYFTNEYLFESKKISSVFNLYFPNTTHPEKKYFLAKSAMLYWDEKGLQRLYNHNPACKILFSVRNPIDRAYSSYKMEFFNGWIKKDFNEIVKYDLIEYLNGKKSSENNDINETYYRLFIEAGHYSVFLRNLYAIFPKEQIKIILFDDIVTDPKKVISNISTWLGINGQEHFNFQTIHNKSYKPRSYFLSTIIYKLKSNGNFLKNFFKKLLPYHLFLKIGDVIESSNKSKRTFETLNSETIKILSNHFKKFNSDFQSITGLEILRRWEDKNA